MTVSLDGLQVDDQHPGTPEDAWTSSGHLTDTEPLTLGRWSAAVVVAPHPDDEVLGAGGLIQVLVDAGLDVTVVAVTDGEASHPRSPAATRLDLGALRARERTVALRRLDASRVAVHRLRIGDGRVAENSARLGRLLAEMVGPDVICVAPWAHDGHPDHDATGRAATAACAVSGTTLISYLVWAWHWATPANLPWSACRRLDLSTGQLARKQHAVAAYRSQTTALGLGRHDGPVLPAAVLERFSRQQEIFVTSPGCDRR